jgi:prolyl-tRNA synthetase
MKLKDSYFYTLRENVKDEESISGNLLVRSAMIKKSSAGVYMYMPLGLRVMKKIENIIREEMNKIGSQELLMPCLILEELYEQSGRRESFGKNMFSLKDRFDKRYALGPTHEELFAIAGKMKVKSYKDLPFSLYQFQNKFRDEPRPRYGLIRVREFIMKDAYTFDKDYEGLDVSYQKMYNAYKSAFDRLGLNYTIVEADTGAMGGLLSEEFQAISDIGEDTLVLCSKCDYASNLEIAECLDTKIDNDEPLLSKELIHTPNAKTIEEVANFMNERADKFVKTILYKVDDKVVACLVKGNREINEVKLRRLLKTGSIELLDFETVELITGAKVGFAGPIDLPVPIIIDNEIKYMKNFIVGANKTDYHYKNVNLTDFNYDLVSDIRYLDAEDGCVKCGAPLVFKKGIEVGNTFKLGTKYADTLGLTYLAADNKLNSVVMGSYGIGLGRCMAAIVEQNHDDKGIIWPMMVAPYQVAIVVVDTNDELQMKVANDLYTQLTDLKIDTILDDRDERIGVKFNDMDLIGIPIRITIGKIVKEEKIEFKLRTGQTEEIKLVDVINRIDEQIKKTIK